MSYSNRRGRSVWKGLAAGALGGLVASFAMNQLQSLWSSTASALSDSGRQQSGGGAENATVKVAAISEAVADKRLPEDQKETAGSAVHYGFGTLVDALYGAVSEWMPTVTAGSGLAYGAAVWLFADEIGVPAFRLAPLPTETPVSSHASALAAHLVYGYVVELTRRNLLKTG